MEPHGVWFSFLAPPGFFFWVVLVIGGWITLGMMQSFFNDRYHKHTWKLVFAFFSAFGTLSLIHFFGDTRALGWLYNNTALVEREETMWLLAPFGLLFWLIILAEFIGLVCFVRFKKGWLATVSIVATLLFMQFVIGMPVFQTLWEHPLYTVAFLVGYVVIGTFWFLFKWDRFTKVQNRLYREVWLPWLELKNISEADFNEAPVEVRGEWWDYFSTHNYSDEHEMRIEFRPSVWAHKADFGYWGSLWPWSMIETFLADFLVELWLFLYHRFSGLLTRIRDRNWRGTEGHEMTQEEMVEYRYNRQKKDWSDTGQRLLSQWTDLKDKGNQPNTTVMTTLKNDLERLIANISREINSGDTESANLQSDLETAFDEVEAASNKGWKSWLTSGSKSNRNTI